MRISKISIENFRGISKCDVTLPIDSFVIIGDNNVGKSTIIEAIDLVLGPERLSRKPIIDEHDFFGGLYFTEAKESIKIKVELIITALNIAQQTTFGAHIEWWNTLTNCLVDETEGDNITAAIRVCFMGEYDYDEDDFTGHTYFSHPIVNGDSLTPFTTREKRECGFLYLRALRTGTRALSLEKGSLLDIILKLKDVRPNMWENVLAELRQLNVAENPELGLSPIFKELQSAIQKFVPAEWGSAPHLKVSDLTRENLRKILTAFIATGAGNYAAPFQHQGTGTINMLVLALLSMIAEEKQNVIFAMEEPEIAIPPYAQKRIVNFISKLSAQAIFTSHSPYVIEEFEPANVFVLRRDKAGKLDGNPIELPSNLKYKRYRQDFRNRFAESLLSRRIFIAEGATEAGAYSTAARKLAEVNSDIYSSLENLGMSICDAGSDSQIATLGAFFRKLGKETYSVFDLQETKEELEIRDNVDYPYMSPYKGMEKMMIEEFDIEMAKTYMTELINENNWPTHLAQRHPSPIDTDETLKAAFLDYFKDDKGSGRIADFLSQCTEAQIPKFIKDTIKSINNGIQVRQLL